MKETLSCSFCGKPKGAISNLVLARKGRSSASICDECLEVCRKILVKSGTAPIVDPSNVDSSNNDAPKSDSAKSYYRIGQQPQERGQLGCSFCGTSQEKAHRLIGSRPGLPPTYICDKCVDNGDAAQEGGNKASIGNWMARKLGRHQTAIHDIK
jgi:ATP-dependent protease Clp ATPase subunit